MSTPSPDVIMLPSRAVIGVLAALSAALVLSGVSSALTPWWMAGVLGLTVCGLFVFGAFKYQIDKNALTSGMLLVQASVFFNAWWPASDVRAAFPSEGAAAWWPVAQRWLFSWHGLDELMHADTMMFILGLTVLVAGVAQSRLLESATLGMLRWFGGRVVPTTLALTALVSVASGLLGGEAMIGLQIRTLAILLFLVKADDATRRYAVIVATVVTTVCGMWLAYGEPPNLIMKANVTSADGQILLDDRFFLTWCLPLAFASFLVVSWGLTRRLAGLQVREDEIDVLEAHAATFRFLQAERHGEVYTAFEVVEDHLDELGPAGPEALRQLGDGHSLGEALIQAGAAPPLRQRLLGILTHEELAAPLDDHFGRRVTEGVRAPLPPEIALVIEREEAKRQYAQRAAIVGLVVFAALLITHTIDHRLPLVITPFVGAIFVYAGLYSFGQTARLATREAAHEYREYLFLIPLFISVTLLTQTGFFDVLQHALQQASQTTGPATVALSQLYFCTGLSAILDNNVVADFGSRALLGLDLGLIYLFSAAQMAGYALGGCWTHIGSVQSVIAFLFIRRDIDPSYAPSTWIREVTPLILQLLVVLTLLIMAMAWWAT